MLTRATLCGLVALLVLSLPPAIAQGACYTQSDCECAASESNLRDGLWHATIEPGAVTASNGRVFELNTAAGPLNLISSCDGTLFIEWTDEEAGLINWELRRVNQGIAVPNTTAAPGGLSDFVPQIEGALWKEFEAISPELADFTSANEFYYGETIYNFAQGSMPATMLMGYSGLPGRAHTNGDVTITMKLGPFQGHTLWARTGNAKFEWVGDSDASRAFVFEQCRCEEVIIELESARLGARLQRAVTARNKNRELRRMGYDTSVNDGIMQNERFDAALPWMRPTGDAAGNWPCLTPNAMDLQGLTTQQEFQSDFDQEWGPIRDRLTGVSTGQTGNSETAAETSARTCEIDPPASDACGDPQIVQHSYMTHEEIHARSCRDRNARVLAVQAQLENAMRGDNSATGLTRGQAERAMLEDVAQCLSYAAYVRNAYNAASEELRAYQAGIEVLEAHVGQYCTN